MERKLLEAMSREEPLSLPAADSSPTEGSPFGRPDRQIWTRKV